MVGVGGKSDVPLKVTIEVSRPTKVSIDSWKPNNDGDDDMYIFVYFQEMPQCQNLVSMCNFEKMVYTDFP